MLPAAVRELMWVVPPKIFLVIRSLFEADRDRVTFCFLHLLLRKNKNS